MNECVCVTLDQYFADLVAKRPRNPPKEQTLQHHFEMKESRCHSKAMLISHWPTSGCSFPIGQHLDSHFPLAKLSV